MVKMRFLFFSICLLLLVKPSLEFRIGLRCSEKAQASCRTEVAGNNCTRSQHFNQYVCSCDYTKGFTLHLHVDWSGYTHRCVRSECTEEERSYCLTSLGNECKVITENETQCTCNQGFIPEDGELKKLQGCRRKVCHSQEHSAKCQTHLAGNRCNDNSNGNYSCICHEPGFQITTDGKSCFSPKCEDPRDHIACRTSFRGNKCSIVDGRHRQCVCNASRFHARRDERTNNTECWLTECTPEATTLCDPYQEGNECVISDGINFECKCSAPGSAGAMLSEHGYKRCFSTLCRARADIYACKSELDGNMCNLQNTTVRKCTCNAPGYEVDPLNEDACWRTTCVSYEQQQCHTQASGNTCLVVADIHTCECNAPGYETEDNTSLPQRCLKKRKNVKSTHAKQRTNYMENMLDSTLTRTTDTPSVVVPEDMDNSTDTAELLTELVS